MKRWGVHLPEVCHDPRDSVVALGGMGTGTGLTVLRCLLRSSFLLLDRTEVRKVGRVVQGRAPGAFDGTPNPRTTRCLAERSCHGLLHSLLVGIYLLVMIQVHVHDVVLLCQSRSDGGNLCVWASKPERQ